MQTFLIRCLGQPHEKSLVVDFVGHSLARAIFENRGPVISTVNGTISRADPLHTHTLGRNQAARFAGRKKNEHSIRRGAKNDKNEQSSSSLV